MGLLKSVSSALDQQIKRASLFAEYELEKKACGVSFQEWLIDRLIEATTSKDCWWDAGLYKKKCPKHGGLLIDCPVPPKKILREEEYWKVHNDLAKERGISTGKAIDVLLRSMEGEV